MQWLLAGTGTDKVLQPRAWDPGTWLGVCSGFGAAAAPQTAGCNGVAPLFLHQLWPGARSCKIPLAATPQPYKSGKSHPGYPAGVPCGEETHAGFPTARQLHSPVTLAPSGVPCRDGRGAPAFLRCSPPPPPLPCHCRENINQSRGRAGPAERFPCPNRDLTRCCSSAEEEKLRGSRGIRNGRKFSLFSPDQRSAESREPGWGQEGLAACRARSVPESKHSERGEHLTLLPEFPAVTLNEQN